ncbi:hypothetical protein SPD48_14485 [Pseudogracilibacillus sp. SE30717A]|uniref:hypothetical protein n=1 Tax=Pseudogracilibacillus sp. SE30717A TaxID=3098293 RepID=UPI00300E5A83
MKTTDKRIKECTYCEETFRDNTRPNNKKTCSSRCANEVKKVRQRKEYRIDNPKKPTQREIYYYDHLEYPFWLDERIGDNQEWKIAVPHRPNKVDYIIGVRQVEELNGGRKRRQETLTYNGDEVGSSRTQVHFVEHNREPGEVTSYKMTPEELKEYLASKKVDKV